MMNVFIAETVDARYFVTGEIIEGGDTVLTVYLRPVTATARFDGEVVQSLQFAPDEADTVAKIMKMGS